MAARSRSCWQESDAALARRFAAIVVLKVWWSAPRGISTIFNFTAEIPRADAYRDVDLDYVCAKMCAGL